ncbi:hypothetical protein FRC12_008512 [Ceratobasidium sp. 428]|nr:hypothetical protein FRC12_008512 [Ceratobasidium sp. 428]
MYDKLSSTSRIETMDIPAGAAESDTRKTLDTLAALLDGLSELRKEKNRDTSITHRSTTDERLPSEIEGVKRFRAFDEKVPKLKQKLKSFADVARPLGSSAGLLNAANNVEIRLIQIQYLIRQNAAERFDEIRGEPDPNIAINNTDMKRLHARLTSDIEDLPRVMEELGRYWFMFVDRLNGLPDVVGDSTKLPIIEFAHDISVRCHIQATEAVLTGGL